MCSATDLLLVRRPSLPAAFVTDYFSYCLLYRLLWLPITSPFSLARRTARMTIPALPGLLCFWDFREPAGTDRVAQGPHACRLHERAGPIERLAGGPCSGFAARLREGQWFVAPRPGSSPPGIPS